jgi:hypothetical protein
MNRFLITTVLVATVLAMSSCGTGNRNGTPTSSSPATVKRTAQGMLEDESIFHVEYLKPYLSSQRQVSDVFMTTDEQGLKKNVKLSDIIARYGEPDKTSKTEKDETSALYFNKIQFIADKDGIVHYALIKLR